MGKNSGTCAMEKIDLFRLADLPYVELYRGYNIRRSFSRHIHFVFSLGTVVKGERIFTFNGKSFRAVPGDIIMVNPGETHDNSVNRGLCNTLAIRLEAEEYQRLVKQFYRGELCDFGFRQPVIKDEDLWYRLQRLHELLVQSAPLLAKESRLIEIIFTLFTRHAVMKPPEFKPPVPNVFNDVRDYLSAHYNEDVTLTELGQISVLSPFQLVRLFSREIGVPPHAYLMQARLDRALKLFGKGRTLVEVAHETGFYDQSHFCKAFKRKFGLTPGEYRTHSLL